MSIATFIKQPEAKLDYSIDYTDWLQGDPIAPNGSTWVVPAGITKVTDLITADNTGTTIWLQGGSDGTDYDCKNTVVTVSGRTDSRTITIRVRHR